ncbi:MAG: hypothetical protein ACI8RZ_007136 [Myxococcota bacterium]|jgi:hypothetical protein
MEKPTSQAPPHSDNARVGVIDVACPVLLASGCAATGRWDDGGCSLTGWLRFAIVGAILFLATSPHCAPYGLLMTLVRGGCTPCVECPLRGYAHLQSPLPCHPHPTGYRHSMAGTTLQLQTKSQQQKNPRQLGGGSFVTKNACNDAWHQSITFSVRVPEERRNVVVVRVQS